MNESLSNSSLFVKAAEEYMNAYLASLPDTGEYDHNFTPAFESLIEKLIRRFERLKLLRSIARKVAAVLLALSIGAGALVGLNAEVRAEVQRWIRSITSSNIIYTSTNHGSTGEIPEFEITWLPKNVELTDVIYMQSTYNFSFTDRNSCEKVIHLMVCDTWNSSLSFYANESDYTITEVTINGMHGEIIVNNGSEYNIVWTDEQGGHLYSLGGALDLDTLLRVAKGIKIK